MPGDYSLSDVLERMYTNQLALEAALMELTLHVEQQGGVRGGRRMSVGHCKRSVKTPATSNRAQPSSRIRVSAKTLLCHFRIAAGKPKETDLLFPRPLNNYIFLPIS